LETKRDFLIGCISCIFGLFLYIILIPLSIHQIDSSSFRSGEISPASFPQFIAIGIILSGAALAVRSAITLWRTNIKAKWITVSKMSINSMVITSIVMFAYVIIIKGIGYFEATIVIALAAFWILGYKRWYMVIWALGIAVSVYVLFGRIIKVPLPEGIISERFWF